MSLTTVTLILFSGLVFTGSIRKNINSRWTVSAGLLLVGAVFYFIFHQFPQWPLYRPGKLFCGFLMAGYMLVIIFKFCLTKTDFHTLLDNTYQKQKHLAHGDLTKQYAWLKNRNLDAWSLKLFIIITNLYFSGLQPPTQLAIFLIILGVSGTIWYKNQQLLQQERDLLELDKHYFQQNYQLMQHPWGLCLYLIILAYLGIYNLELI